MKKAGFFNRDYNILSSYLNRWATVIVFSAIIMLAVGAIRIKSNDLAHVPVRIGVCALDSLRAAPALNSFAEFCRGRGCGDIRWKYLRPNRRPSGCDFYCMTALELSPLASDGSLGCALIAAERAGHRYSRSAVIVRAGTTALPREGLRVIFSTTASAAGFLAPALALERAGYSLEGLSCDVSGFYPREERLAFGVLYGAFDAGGISLERFLALEAEGVIRKGELEVYLEGEAFPEIVFAYDPASYTPDMRAFAKRLPGVLDRTPRPLRGELASLSIAGLYPPRESDRALIRKLASMVPAGLHCENRAEGPAASREAARETGGGSR
jgi:hypothetical protein